MYNRVLAVTRQTDPHLKQNKVLRSSISSQQRLSQGSGFLLLTTRNFSIGILLKMSIQNSVRDLIANLIYEKMHTTF